MALEFADE